MKRRKEEGEREEEGNEDGRRREGGRERMTSLSDQGTSVRGRAAPVIQGNSVSKL